MKTGRKKQYPSAKKINNAIAFTGNLEHYNGHTWVPPACLASITMFFNATKSYRLTALFVLYPIALAWIAGALLYTIGETIAG